MCFLACLPLYACQSDTQARRHTQITACAIPNENCAQKKVTSSVPQECSSRPETPKLLVITPEFVGKNPFFLQISRWRPIFLLCFHPRICRLLHVLRHKNLCSLVFTLGKVFVPCKNCLCPLPPQSRYSGAGPGDTNDSILFDHAKYVTLLVKVRIVLNSSCDLEL